MFWEKFLTGLESSGGFFHGGEFSTGDILHGGIFCRSTFPLGAREFPRKIFHGG